jgi:hypothetical protein
LEEERRDERKFARERWREGKEKEAKCEGWNGGSSREEWIENRE